MSIIKVLLYVCGLLITSFVGYKVHAYDLAIDALIKSDEAQKIESAKIRSTYEESMKDILRRLDSIDHRLRR